MKLLSEKVGGENISIFSDSTPAGSAVAAAVAGQARAAGDAVKLCHLPQAKAIGESLHYTSVPFHAFTLYGSIFSRIAIRVGSASRQ